MTREHKLALIIGFTLVLVVGVLISDHFSKAPQLARVPGDFADMQDSASRFGAGLEGLKPVGFVQTGFGGPAVASAQNFENSPPSELPPVRDPIAAGNTRSIMMGVPKGDQAPLPPPIELAGHFEPATSGSTPLMHPVTQQLPEGDLGMPGGGIRQSRSTNMPETIPGAGGAGGSGGGSTTQPPIPKSEPVHIDPPKEEMHQGVPLRMFVRYDVQEGESPYGMAAKKYGDGKLWEKLRDFNKGKIAANGSIRQGVTILLPPKEALLGKPLPTLAPEPVINDLNKPTPAKPTAPLPSAPPTRTDTKPAEKAIAAADKPRTYVVQKGDVLSDVARKMLGSSKRWMEIHDLNKGMLDDENSLQVGMVLKLPAR